MNKKLISLITALSISAAALPIYNIAMAEDESTTAARQMEYLNRGLVAVDTGSGVYLSWRLLGTESLSDQAFDIYRSSDGTTYTKIKTTDVHDATCYTDTSGSASYTYKVVEAGVDPVYESDVATPLSSSVYTNYTYKSSGLTNQTAYIDIPITAPTPDPANTSAGTDYTYSANDMSVGDLDGDGDYEYIVKWDPSNSQDNSNSGYTGNVYLDAYELDGTLLWRIDLGVNIRAGAHYTQFMVYDFDGDGYAELACKTAPGSIDGRGSYVTKVGTSSDITSADNTQDYRNTGGYILDGPEYLTIFDGLTGAALQTVYYDPARDITSDWGDTYGNRCDRFLAGVAYLDGKTPSLIMSRGYYTYAYVAAYTWDGTNLTEQWLSTNNNGSSYAKYADGTTSETSAMSLYGQGAHSLSVADVDNDGYDEIIFGSAILDHNGTVLLSDGRGHGDAEHVSDFDNDGNQEIFMVHEEGKDNDGASVAYAVDLKRYNGDILMQATTGDVGRGFMANALDDTTYGTAQFWSSNVAGVWGYNPNDASNPIEILSDSVSSFINFGIYWDGDLARELLDDNKLAKATTSGFARFTWGSSSATYFPNASSNNSSKSNACLVADLFGDWREEVIFKDETDSTLRIFMSCIPTTYRLTTLMHDSQYRCAVAWQNVGYNQPPHTSYYIGSAALAGDDLNYLDPAVEFTSVYYPETVERTPAPTVEATTAPELVMVAQWDFEDEETAFTNINTDRATLNVEDGSDSSNTTKVLAVTAQDVNANYTDKIERAQLDFSDYVEGADTVKIEFDAADFSNITNTRANYLLIDSNKRTLSYGTDTSTGTLYQIGNTGSNNAFKINGTAKTAPSETWVHITVEADYTAKTLDYTVTSLDGNTTYFSAENTAYYDTSCSEITAIEIMNWNGTTTYIDNIEVYVPETLIATPTPTPTATPTPTPTASPVETATPTPSTEASPSAESESPSPTETAEVSPSPAETTEASASPAEETAEPEWEYTIDDITVDSTEQVSVTYTNVSGTGGVLIVAVYGANNTLTGVKITNISDAESPAQVQIDTSNAINVSAYIWKTVESQKPLSAKKTVPTSE